MENDTAETQVGLGERETEGERETGRLEAFSDGVFAIAVTLLILTIQVPSSKSTPAGKLSDALGALWPSFVAYVVSFAFILIMWVNHHNLFRLIHRTDQTFLMLNGLLLLCVTFVPFPTALLAEYLKTTGSDQMVAALVFNGSYILIAVAFNLLWRYASYHGRLLSRRADPQVVAGIHRRFNYGPLYILCFLLTFWNVWASLALNVAMAGFYALPGGAPRRARAEAEVLEAERIG